MPAINRGRIYGLLAALLGGLVYINALNNPFVYDDHVHVVGKEAIRHLGSPGPILMSDQFRPLVNLSYALDYAFWQLDPFGYHLTGVAVHCLNVLLLYLVALGLLRDTVRLSPRDPPRGVDLFEPARRQIIAAFGAAALLAVHPMMSEAVGYISGRAEVLCATFFLLSFLGFRRGILSGKKRWTLLGALALLAGLGAKENGAMLPLALLAYDRFILAPADPEGAGRRVRRLHLPLVSLFTIAGIVRVVVLVGYEYDALPRPVMQNLLMEGTVIWRYLLLMVAPVGQSVVHQVRPVTTALDPVALGAAAGLISLLALTLALRRQAPMATLGGLWFLLLIAPSSSVIPLLEPMAEHRVYLASVGLFLAAGAGLYRVLCAVDFRGPGVALLPRVALTVVLLVLSVATVLRNRVWQDPISLWSDAIASAPGVWAPHYALGDAYKRRGHCKEALGHYHAAIKVLPEEPRAHLNLGICLATLKQDAEATRVFKNVLTLEPDNIKAHNNLGQLALRAKKWDEADGHFKVVLRKNQRNLEAMASLGVSAKMQKDADSAVLYLEGALVLDPTNTYALMHLAHTHEALMKDPATALKLYKRVVSLAPDTLGAAEGVHRCEEWLKLKR